MRGDGGRQRGSGRARAAAADRGHGDPGAGILATGPDVDAHRARRHHGGGGSGRLRVAVGLRDDGLGEAHQDLLRGGGGRALLAQAWATKGGERERQQRCATMQYPMR